MPRAKRAKTYELSRLASDNFGDILILLRRIRPGRVTADHAMIFMCQCARQRLLAEYRRRGLDPEAVIAETRKPKVARPMPDLTPAPAPRVDS